MQEKQAQANEAKRASEQAAMHKEEASLTGLESQRQANIKRNQQRLAEVGLNVKPAPSKLSSTPATACLNLTHFIAA